MIILSIYLTQNASLISARSCITRKLGFSTVDLPEIRVSVLCFIINAATVKLTKWLSAPSDHTVISVESRSRMLKFKIKDLDKRDFNRYFTGQILSEP